MTGGGAEWICPSEGFDIHFMPPSRDCRLGQLCLLDMHATTLTEVDAELKYDMGTLIARRRGVNKIRQNEIDHAVSTMCQWAADRHAHVYCWRHVRSVRFVDEQDVVPVLRMLVVPLAWNFLRVGHSSGADAIQHTARACMRLPSPGRML